MRQLFIAGLFTCLLTLSACGGEGDDATTIHSASPVPIQDKVWSVPYGLAHDGQTNQIAFNASGPVATAWWHIEATSPTAAPPYTFVCLPRTRSWLKTACRGPVENLMGPGPSDSSYRYGEVDVHANSAGDALVVANPAAPVVVTLFRRLRSEANWQPVTAMSAGAGLQSNHVVLGEVFFFIPRYLLGLATFKTPLIRSMLAAAWAFGALRGPLVFSAISDGTRSQQRRGVGFVSC